MVTDIQSIIRQARDSGLAPEPAFHIHIPFVNNYAIALMREFTHRDDIELFPEYQKIFSWLEDNNHKGLLFMGDTGVGKTLLCARVIPALVHAFHERFVSCYHATELNERWNEVRTKYLIMVDDVGTEDISNNYGERHCRFAELVDLAERHGKLLIITTNLGSEAIKQRYGERTYSRLRGLTTAVNMFRESMQIKKDKRYQ